MNGVAELALEEQRASLISEDLQEIRARDEHKEQLSRIRRNFFMNMFQSMIISRYKRKGIDESVFWRQIRLQ